MSAVESTSRSGRALNPAIAGQLEAFAERRRRLIVRRGLYAGLVALLVAMSLAAAIDRFVLLEDAARYAISGAAWMAVLVVLWRTCLRRLILPPDQDEVARMVERVRPELKEDLLSAVELGYGLPGRGWDSPVFRDLLQQDVADRMQGIDVEALLPFRLIRRWSRGAIGVGVVCLLLLAAPGLHFYRPFLRALIPGINLQRVSRTQIAVTEPRPADTVVPRGDTVTVVAELSGAPADTARLESIQGGKRVRVPMKQVASHRFSADLDIGDEEVHYRIRAGDAMTRKYKLTAVPPPSAIRFSKSYRYPPYLGWEEREAAGTDGNLEAPEGTGVELTIEVDQPVRTAELVIDIGEQPQTIELEPTGERTLRTSLILSETGTYRVHLVADPTGFSNRFSPEYEITVHLDQVPSVELIQPARERVVMPDEILDMEAVARDDFGLAELKQRVRVNRGPWRSGFRLDAGSATEQIAAHAWDLLDLDLQPGDRLLTKYLAVDRKGSQGESTVLKLTVGSRRLYAGSDRRLEERKQVARSLTHLRDSAEDLRKVAAAAEKTLGEGAPEPTLDRQQQLQLAAAATRVRQRAEEAMDAVRQALAKADDRLDVDDLATTGRALSRATRTQLERGQRELEDADDRDAMRAGGKTLARAANQLADVTRNFGALLAAGESRHLQHVLEALHQEQQALPAEAETSGRERARRKQEMVAAQVSEVETALDELKDWSRSSRSEIDQIRKDMAPAGELPPEDAPFDTELAGRMSELLGDAANRLKPVSDRLGEDAEKAREQLSRQAGRVVADVQEARKALESLQRSPEKSPAEAAAAVETAADLLADRADWEERSTVGQAPWARDLDRAARAMAGASPVAADKPETAEAVERLRTLEDVLRDLEAGQTMADTWQAAERLAHEEQWGGAARADERAMAWKRLDSARDESERTLRQSDLPESSTVQFAEALRGPEARNVGQEMDARLTDPTRTPLSQFAPLTEVAEALGEAWTEAELAILAARERLAQLSPSLHERFAALGDEAEALAGDTAAAAQAPVAAEAEALLERQEGLTEGVNAARGALRRDALAQDLVLRQGRERARDADDALAMLQGLPEAAEALLRQAPDPRLGEAAEEQGMLAEALDTLAQHYANLESGQAEITRPGLRAREEALGIAGELDAQYGALERLAAMLDQDPAGARLALEQELATDAAMRDELSAVARNTIEQAAATVRETAEREIGLAGQVADLGQETDREASQLQQRAEALAERAGAMQRERIPDLATQARDAGVEADSELQQADRAAEYLAGHFPTDMDALRADAAAPQASEAGDQMQEAAESFKSVAARAPGGTLVQTEAGGAAGEAESMAAEAHDIAAALRQLSDRQPSALRSMAGNQEALTETARGAASDIDRAARHESRLGTDRHQVLRQIGQSTRATADNEMDRASGMLTRGIPAEQTAPVAVTAGEALQARAGELEQMISAYPPITARAAAMTAPGDRVGQWMARALDRLDAGSAAESGPAELAQAAQAQAVSMARSRTPMPGGPSDSRQGAPIQAPALAATPSLPPATRESNRLWAALPEQMARQLRDGTREAVPEEYREMVDAYFKRIAQEGQP